jgi:DNA-binding Lrp family transcriptional regulator
VDSLSNSPSEPKSLDELDRALLHALQTDGRAPFSRIAAVLGVSDQTVARRYRRLRADHGMRVVGVADPDRLGRTSWMLRLRCTPDAAEPIAKALARRPDTAWIALTSGGTEVTCVTRARTRQEHDALLFAKLPRTPSIVGIDAHCVLHVFYGGAAGWHNKGDALAAEQVAPLAPPAPEPAAGPVVLDPADELLMAELARDGRASYPDLQRATGCSESAVKRRLEQLRRSGAVYLDVQMDAMELGYESQALLWITVAPSALATVGKALAGHPEVAFAAATSGRSNLAAVVICRDAARLYTYLSETLGMLEGVQNIETSPMLRRVKQLMYEEKPR